MSKYILPLLVVIALILGAVGTGISMTRESAEIGPEGPEGQQGDIGPQGPEGPQGEKGDKGNKGDTGATGPQGPRGPRGYSGEDGEDGEDCECNEPPIVLLDDSDSYVLGGYICFTYHFILNTTVSDIDDSLTTVDVYYRFDTNNDWIKTNHYIGGDESYLTEVVKYGNGPMTIYWATETKDSKNLVIDTTSTTLLGEVTPL